MFDETKSGVTFPSREAVERGDFDYLKDGKYSSYWRHRYGLVIDENGDLVASDELKELWAEQDK